MTAVIYKIILQLYELSVQYLFIGIEQISNLCLDSVRLSSIYISNNFITIITSNVNAQLNHSTIQSN